MRSAQTTIKDIARELGISPSTVSRALKDHPDISVKTKRAVNELAAKLKYRPNAIALSLRSSKSNVIGVIIPEIVHHFFSSVISGIEDVAYNAGYNVMICQSNESYSRELSSAQALLASRVDGLLVSASKETNNFEHFANIQSNGIPLVFFDRIGRGLHTDSVVVDDVEGAYKATKHLIEQGCKRIVHLAGPPNLLIGQKRARGYIKALKEFNLPVINEYLVHCDTYENALKMVPQLLQLPEKPDGIFAVNDLTAIAAISAAKKLGFHIPSDLAVVGFTNGLSAKIADPQLSSIEQRGYDMGEAAANILLKRIAAPLLEGEKAERKTLQTELIIRESSLRKTSV